MTQWKSPTTTKAPKPNTPGPIEQRLLDQMKAPGAFYVHLPEHEDMAKLHWELKQRHDIAWRAVNNAEKPPSWANCIFHGWPLVIGGGLVRAGDFMEALQLLRDFAKETGRPTVSFPLSRSVVDYLKRMAVPLGPA